MPGQEVGGAAAGAGRCHRAVRIWTFTLTFDYVDKGRAKAGPHHEAMGHYSDGPLAVAHELILTRARAGSTRSPGKRKRRG